MLALAAICLAIAPQGLAIGKATTDITPDARLPLGGYTERGSKSSIAGGDKLYARTVLFDAGKTKIAVASVEMLTAPESLYREVKKRIPSDITLFLAATHTHSAPDSQMLNDRMTFAIPGIAKYDPKWLQWYAEKIASSVNSSLRGRSPCYAVFDVEGHASVNAGRRKSANPDTLVSQILCDRENHAQTRTSAVQLEPLILQYAAHGTVYPASEMRVRGDWPGVAATTFKSAVLQGPIGDVLPKEDGKSPEQSIDLLVRGLQEALSVHPKELTLPIDRVWTRGNSIGAESTAISLDAVQPHPTMAKSYGVPEAFAEGIVKQFAPTSANITAFRIGKLAVVGVPGEPTSILGRQIRDAGRRMGFRSVLVCSHVNGWMGYILAPEDYDRGGYEATLSFYGREEGTKVVEAGIKALKALTH